MYHATYYMSMKGAVSGSERVREENTSLQLHVKRGSKN